jgi:hypothetical protein
MIWSVSQGAEPFTHDLFPISLLDLSTDYWQFLQSRPEFSEPHFALDNPLITETSAFVGTWTGGWQEKPVREGLPAPK